MYNKNDLKRMFLAGMLFTNTNKNPSQKEVDDAFEMSINAFEAAQQSAPRTCVYCGGSGWKPGSHSGAGVICDECGGTGASR